MAKRVLIQKVLPWMLTFVFIALLSFYSYKLFVNNYFTLFDLGLSYRLSYLFSRTLTPVYWPGPFVLASAKPYTKTFYFVTGLTLLLYNSPFTILVDQIIVIGVGSLALHRISMKKTSNFRLSIGLQLIYFLYPSTYGFITQGGNYMVFLEGLLLLNYMFYLEHRPLFFVITGILCVLTNSWAPIILLSLYFVEWMNLVHIGTKLRSAVSHVSNFLKWLGKRRSDRRAVRTVVEIGQLRRKAIERLSNLSRTLTLSRNVPYLIVALVSIAVFVGEAHAYSLSGLVVASRASISSGTSTAASFSYSSKLSFIYNQFSPLLFTPLMSIFVLPVIAYFIILTAFTNYPPYYSSVTQYAFLYAGFLFISMTAFFGQLKSTRMSNRILALIAVSSVLSFLIASPFNIGSITSGQLGAELSNSETISEINHAYSLIPVHSSVFIQNDMPQLMNRDVVYTAGYYNNQTVDYAVLNPIPLNSVVRTFGGFSLYWANHFAKNSSYGVYESVDGAMVYALDYHSSPVFYVPSDYLEQTGSTFTLGQFLPYSEYVGTSPVLLSPGSYNVTFALSANNSSLIPQSFEFRAYNSAGQIVSSSMIFKSSFSYASGLYYVSFYLREIEYTFIQLTLFSTELLHSQGTFMINYVKVSQISY